MKLFLRVIIGLVIFSVILKLVAKKGLGKPLDIDWNNLFGGFGAEQQQLRNEIVGKGNPFNASTIDVHRPPPDLSVLEYPFYLMVREGEQVGDFHKGGDLMRITRQQGSMAVWYGVQRGPAGQVQGEYYWYWPELRKKVWIVKAKSPESGYSPDQLRGGQDVELATAPRPTGNPIADAQLGMESSAYDSAYTQQQLVEGTGVGVKKLSHHPRWTGNPIADTMMARSLTEQPIVPDTERVYRSVSEIPTVTGDSITDYLIFYQGKGGRI